MNPLWSVLSQIYRAASLARNKMYDTGWLQSEQVSVPVVSIGNLTVGGTGKTPIVDLCTRILKSHGHRVAIICRSYRATATKPGRVQINRPEIFGDEAVWYAERHPDVAVWSGPSKSETAKELVRTEKVDVILIDDGFQHRRLKRDLNLLLMDATDARSAYDCVPAGRARESYAGAGRADAILITKSNLGTKQRIAEIRQDFPNKPIFEFESALAFEGIEIEAKYVAVSGIARPESFHQLLKEAFPRAEFVPLIFPDHHAFTKADVARIESVAHASGAKSVACTEKDDTKLRPLWTSSLPLRALSLEVRPKASVESFYELLSRAIR